MKKYYIKTGLVIIIILVSISALVAYLATKDNYKRVNNYDNLIPVEDYNTYFAITNNITNYLKATTDKETDQLYMLLDQKYIDRKRITKNNVHKKIPTYTEETIMEVESMKMATQDSGNVIYYATGKLIDNKYLEPQYINENYSIIVIVDYKSFTVSIYPVSDNPIDDINSILEINIPKNKYNGMKTTGFVAPENICNLYLIDYIEKLNDNITKAYNITNTNQSEDEFKTYINKNLDKINTAIKSCDYDQDNKIYTVYDYNDNQFIFTETSVMNYRVSFTLK